MAFGLPIDFTGVIGGLTKNLTSIASSTIQNLSNTAKKALINTTNSNLTSNLKSMIGTSLNLNLSKLTGGINFTNALNGLKDLPFPSLGSLNINSLFGLIDQNIGLNLNKFSKGLVEKYGKISLDEISLTDKITTAIDNQAINISKEIEAGIISGKSSLISLDSLSNLSNTQIRDFSLDPAKQLSYVNNLVEQQKSNIFDLSFNFIPETKIFNNQTFSINQNSLKSPISFLSDSGSTLPDIDYSFNKQDLIKNVNIKPKIINEELTEIDKLTKVEQPNTRRVNLNRYTKEKDSLTQIKDYINDVDNEIVEIEVSSNLVDKETVEDKGLEVMRDPDTDEIIGYVDRNDGTFLDIYGNIT
jgi:hypothetical protein